MPLERLLNLKAMATALYIENQLADIFERSDLSPRIYKRLFDLENIGERRGDKAINLKLPRTANNSALLGYIDSVYTAGNFFAARSFDAAIVADGQDLLAGRLWVEAITPEAFECSLTGRNIAWADALRGLRAQELPIPCVNYSGAHSTAIDPILDQASQQTVSLFEIWQAGVEGYPFAMPLIGYGNFPCEQGNTATNPINGVSTIEDSAGLVDGAIIDNSQANPFSIFDFVPAPYLRDVLEAAMVAAGYSAAGDVFSDPYFEGICFPSTLERSEMDRGFNFGLLAQGTLTYNRSSSGVPPNSWGVLAGDDGDYRGNLLGTDTWAAAIDAVNKTAVVGPQNPAIVNSASGIANPFLPIVNPETNANGLLYGLAAVTVATDAALKVRWTASIRLTLLQTAIDRALVALVALTEQEVQDFASNTLTPDVPGANAYIQDGTLPTINDRILAYDTFVLTDDNGRNDPLELVADRQYEAGQYIVPMLFLYHQDGSSLINAVTLSGTTLKIEQSDVEADLLCPARFLPDESAADFLRAIVQHFNLYISVDEASRTVFFNTRQTYFFGNETAYDWTGKANEQVLEARPPEYYAQIDLRYAREDDEPLFTASQFDAVYTTPGDYYTEQLERESFFAATGLRSFVLLNQDARVVLNSLGDADEYAKTLGELATDEETQTYDWLPRVVRYTGLVEVAPGPDATTDALWVDDLGYRKTYVSGSTFDGPIVVPVTRFDDALTLSYADRPGGRQGLFRRYFQDEFEQVARAVIIKLPVMLDNSDVLNLDVRRPVRIGQLHYIINEVEGYDPTTPKLTPVTLLRK